MTQTYRTNDPARWGTGQGFNLSPAQVDINFWDLIQRMITQEARPDPSAGISYFSISGTMMYVHMTDGTTLGPYELPVATFLDRGVWAPATVYNKMNTFTINGGLYVVVFDHTSGATFDPGANDGAGHDYYQLMIQTPGSSLPSGGAVGQLLKKTTTADYAVGWGYTDASVVSFEPATGSALTANNVADALEELTSGGAVAASGVSYTPSTASGLTSTNVQDALDELGSGGGGGGGGAAGKQTIWIPATAMTPRTTSGAEAGSVEMATNKNMVRTLDFDAATPEYAQFDVAMPKSWDANQITYRIFWSHAVTTVNFTVAFGLAAVSVPSNSSSLDVAFWTDGDAIGVGGTANSLYMIDRAGGFAIRNSSSGLPVYGDIVMFRIFRDATSGSDNLAIDARLHGIQIIYNATATTDD